MSRIKNARALTSLQSTSFSVTYFLMIAATFILGFIIILILPQDVFAWGPATHLEIGLKILHHANALPKAIAALIERFPYDFLYGNISADIVVGKNLVKELKHCHNWSFGFKLLKKARGGSQKAFAYGYLSHLASDTIAHNHFIPEMTIKSFSSTIHRHIYWEMRFDSMVDKRIWDVPKKMVKRVHTDNDKLLSSILEGTPLSFRTNKTIFSSMLSINRVEHWHRMLYLLSAASRWKLLKSDKDRYVSISLKNAQDILAHPHSARCIRKDPRGKESLERAKTVMKTLKKLKRSGAEWESHLERALKDVEK